MSSEKEIYKAKSVHCDEDHVTFEREERDQLRITATMYPWPVNDEPRKPDVISIVVDGDDATEIACEIMNAYQVESLTETEQKATIETLRRRVAELEEQAQRDDSATYHLSQMVKSLTAKNAELKRQVEALREDAEVGALVKLLIAESGEAHLMQGSPGYWVDFCDARPSILEALREAAKEGGVE